MDAIGSRAKVWHGTAHHTSGGLTREHLKMNKHGRIVSRTRSKRGHHLHALSIKMAKTKRKSTS